MNEGIILTTERLVLRDYVEGDWRAVHQYAADPEVVRFMDWGPNTEQQTRDFIARTIGQHQANPRRGYELAVVLKDGGRLIGGCGLRVRRRQFGFSASKKPVARRVQIDMLNSSCQGDHRPVGRGTRTMPVEDPVAYLPSGSIHEERG